MTDKPSNFKHSHVIIQQNRFKKFFINAGLIYHMKYLKLSYWQYLHIFWFQFALFRYLNFQYDQENILITVYESILKLMIIFNPEAMILNNWYQSTVYFSLAVLLLNFVFFISYCLICIFVTRKQILTNMYEQSHKLLSKTSNLIIMSWYTMSYVLFQYYIIILTYFLRNKDWLNELKAIVPEIIMAIFKVSIFANFVIFLIFFAITWAYNHNAITNSNFISFSGKFYLIFILAFKIFTSIYIVLNPEYKDSFLFPVISLIFLCIALIASLLENAIYNLKTHLFACRITTILLLLTVFNLLKITNTIYNEIIFFLISSFALTWAIKHIYIGLKNYWIKRKIALIKKTDDPNLKIKLCQSYITNLLWYYKNIENEPLLLKQLKNLYIQHIFNCNISQCVCKKQSTMVDKETCRQYIISLYEFYFKDNNVDMDYHNIMFHLKYNTWVSNNYIYSISLIQNNIYKHYSLNQTLNIMLCYHYYSLLWRKNDMVHIQLTEIDVRKLVSMSLTVEYTYNTIENCVQTHKELWRTICNSSKDILEVERLIDNKFTQEEDINKKFKIICEKFQEDFRLTYIYGVFCCNVLFNYKKFRKLLNLLENLKLRLELDQYMALQVHTKFNFNNDNLVLVASGSEKTIGIIKDLFYNYYDFLGYEKEELIDKSVNVLIPQCIATYHDEIMSSYFKHGRTKLLNNIIPVYMLHKKQYVVPGEVYLKTTLNYSFGIDFVLFFSPGIDTIFNDNKRLSTIREKINYILFDEKNKILNVGKDFDTSFSLPKAFYRSMLQIDRKSKNYYLEELFPELETNILKLETLREGSEIILTMNQTIVKDEADIDINKFSKNAEIFVQVFYSGSVFNNKMTLYYAYLYKKDDLTTQVQSKFMNATENNKIEIFKSKKQNEISDTAFNNEDNQGIFSEQLNRAKEIYIKTKVNRFSIILMFLLYIFITIIIISYILILIVNSHYNNKYFKEFPRIFNSFTDNNINLYNTMFNLNNIFYKDQTTQNELYINTTMSLTNLYDNYNYINNNITLTNTAFYSETFINQQVVNEVAESMRIYYYDLTSEYSYKGSYPNIFNMLNSYIFYISKSDETVFNNKASIEYNRILTYAKTIWGTITNNFLSNSETYFAGLSDVLQKSIWNNYLLNIVITSVELPLLVIVFIMLIIVLLKLPKQYYNDLTFLFKYNDKNYEKYINKCSNIEKLIEYVKKHRLAKLDINNQIDNKFNHLFHNNIENTIVGTSVQSKSINRITGNRNLSVVQSIKNKMRLTLQCALIITFLILISLAFIPKVSMGLLDYRNKKDYLLNLTNILAYKSRLSQAYYGTHNYLFNPNNNISSDIIIESISKMQQEIQNFNVIVQKFQNKPRGFNNFSEMLFLLNSNICNFYSEVINEQLDYCLDEKFESIYNRGEQFASLYIYDELNKKMSTNTESFVYDADMMNKIIQALNFCIEAFIIDLSGILTTLNYTATGLYIALIIIAMIVMIIFGKMLYHRIKLIERNHKKLIKFLNEEEIEKSKELQEILFIKSNKYNNN